MPTTFCRLFTFAFFPPLSRGRCTSTSLFTGRRFLPKRMKATLNWWHWILFSVPAVSPHPASVWQTHHPSHRKSPLTGPAAASSWSSFIIPADWLVELTHRPMGSFSCWGPGWSEALASPLHEWRPGRMGRKACHYTETRGGWGVGGLGGI